MRRIFTFLLMVIFGVVGMHAQINNQIIDIDNPQWEKVIGANEGPSMSKFAEANGKMWTIEKNGQLLFSEDNGQTWELHQGGSSLKNQQIFAGDFGVILTRLAETGHFTTYTAYYDVYYSENNGETFIKRDGSLLKYSQSTHVISSSFGLFKKSQNELIEISRTSAIGGPYYRVNNTIDSGITWTSHLIFSGSTFKPISIMRFDVQNDTLSTLIQREDSTWFLNIYTDDYENPTIHTFTLSDQIIVSNFHFSNNHLLLQSSDGRIFSSFDLGQTWDIHTYSISPILNLRFGLNEFFFRSDSQFYSINYNDLNNAQLLFEFNADHPFTFTEASVGIIVSIPAGVYLRPQEGLPFDLIGNGLPGFTTDFHIAGDVLWTKTKIWYRSDDDGLNWSLAPLDLLDDSKILTDYNDVFILEKDNIIYQSTDNGFNWDSINIFQSAVEVIEKENGIFIYDNFKIYFSGNGVDFTEVIHPPGVGKFVWYDNQLLYFFEGLRYVSDNNGINWGIPEPTQGANGGIIENNSNQLVSIQNQGCCGAIRHSNDGGFTWIENSFLHPLFFPYFDVVPQYAGNADGIQIFNHRGSSYVTANNGEHWARIQTPFIYFANVGGFTNEFISGPLKIAQKEDLIYGVDEVSGVYRTLSSFFKDQLPNTPIIKNQISGHLYKDLNDNCIKDPSDATIPNKVIHVGDQHLRTNDNGWYGLFYDFTNTEVPYQTDSIRHTEINCENNYEGIFQLDENVNTDTIDIAFHPIPGITDGGIIAWTTGIFRPGGTPQIRIQVTNHGTVPLDNENIILTYNPSLQTISENSDGTALNNNQWQIPVNLEPAASQTFIVRLDISTSAINSDLLNYIIDLPINGDAYPTDNQVSIIENIVTSIDPNDKTVYAQTTLPLTENEFIYRIRFQNTGNDTAFKVVILDTLPQELDLLSLEMLDASHPYEMKINDPVLRWTFQDILLPDSTTNEPESHGYLFFKIKTKNDLAISDTIKNSAAIYFDYNDPVITEEAITEIEKGYLESDFFFSICLGEEINGIAIFMDTTITTIDTTNQVYNLVTNSIFEVEPTYYLDSLIVLHPGDTILGVPVFTDTTIVYHGLTTQGCDSIINFQVSLLTNTSVLDFSDFSILVRPNPTIGAAHLLLDFSKNENLNISLHNLNGQKVKQVIRNQNVPIGSIRIPLNMNDLLPGVYWVRVQTESYEKSIRVVKME